MKTETEFFMFGGTSYGYLIVETGFLAEKVRGHIIIITIIF
jgi:hypothetical protein